ncbi:bifunctional DNA primase/polymerase [Sphingomonas lutea]|uniref:Bifunctional DNA primase/polymerase n=1 Tax=Sphingomonas lutea TaxID=1045317 RepID=A0A7G9SF14_9SPHN|nr:bifunctional DNA primase/polymerase [Sphingomonas lutea]QNN66439.1 bifunctional DNA primase/polymerase [Sphingomonas lutea]
MISSENQLVARTYCASDVPVFPCKEAGEGSKSPYVANGFHEATARLDRLNDWAAKYPTAIYGLPCSANNVLVLDADRHGNGDGVANVMAIYAQHGFDWRSVPAVHTPRDGLHFFFQKPKTLGKTKGRLADAVDVRDNGYVIAPGNKLPDGRRYAILNGTLEQLVSAIANRALPIMPDWLVTAVLQPYRVPSRSSVPATPEIATNQLSGLIQAVVRAPTGSRNRLLFWAACRLGDFVDAGVVQRDVAFALLFEAGQQAGLSRREAQATSLSGLRRGELGRGC